MDVKRVATSRKASDDALIVEWGKERFTVSQADAAKLTSASLAASLSAVSKEAPTIHFHRNRDGSIAVATGVAPETWPEDEVKK